MPETPLNEKVVAQYIAEQADELITLVNFCEPVDRVQFLTYLLDMVRIEAKQLFEECSTRRPYLVHSETKPPLGN